ncbi:hypothetical protein [Streptomyces gardneri]|uniref:Polymerase nucleotidyl transferase domain-containing protein n=1 Tax=Streptomyces gardneri TaxID=66892 RepID=A0A4Y3RKC6_9ACTN|nr:hypothetical protein [Streptomyces gardneri]GEB57147.1 hypothetical protein SGA01_27520 [Streptomyces gardneri]GHH16314.1 hypothetical protein GCM10017674_66100 [Streptomyces gardneri]
MKAADLPDLVTHLRTTLAATHGTSVGLSGSLARGDYRTSDNGTVTSDLDLIPIVPRATDVPAVRRQITPVLQDVTDRFAIDATAAITLLAVYRQVPCASYITSMAGRQFLVDPLNLGTAPSFTHTTDDLLPWLIQPITYYLAKASHEDPITNLAKARAAALHLTDHLGLDDRDAPRDLTRTVREVYDRYDVTLLASSAAYLNAPTAPDRFQAVRDLVFMENQGIPFTDSALAAPRRHQRTRSTS